jgi:hypothetical protein
VDLLALRNIGENIAMGSAFEELISIEKSLPSDLWQCG